MRRLIDHDEDPVAETEEGELRRPTSFTLDSQLSLQSKALANKSQDPASNREILGSVLAQWQQASERLARD